VRFRLWTPTTGAPEPQSGRHSNSFTKLNIAVFAPMPTARTNTATATKPGAFANMRSAY
jgi:hypothetical protein